MKRILPIALVAGLTFLLVWFFLKQSESPSVDLESRRKTPFEVSNRDPALTQTRDPDGFEGVVTRSTRLKEEERSVGEGSLLVAAKLPNGKAPEDFKVVTDPPLPEGSMTASGLLFDDIKVGHYQVTVHGYDIVPVVQRSVAIEEGNLKQLTFQVVRGIRPKGIVLDADGDRPIAGARIDFNGMARAVSGPDGRFEIPILLPRRALEVVDLRAPNFDFQLYRGKIFPDPSDMRLYLGGSEGIMVGQIQNASGQAFPDDAVVRLTLPPLFDLRREVELKGQTAFRLENLYPGHFQVELHFPGGEFPTLNKRVEVPSWQPGEKPLVSVELVLEAGIDLSGEVEGVASHLAGVAFELRDFHGRVVASTKIDDELRYAFRNLARGSYFPVLLLPGGELQLQTIEIEGTMPMRRDIDVGRRRWKP